MFLLQWDTYLSRPLNYMDHMKPPLTWQLFSRDNFMIMFTKGSSTVAVACCHNTIIMLTSANYQWWLTYVEFVYKALPQVLDVKMKVLFLSSFPLVADLLIWTNSKYKLHSINHEVSCCWFLNRKYSQSSQSTLEFSIVVNGWIDKMVKWLPSN